MISTLGVIFAGLLIGLPLLILDIVTDSDFLKFFSKELSVGILLAILALNVAVVTFLLGHLIALEEKLGMNFNKTRRELRHNIYFMTILVLLNFALASAGGPRTFQIETVSGQTVMGYMSAVITLLVIYAMLEIINLALNFKGAQGQP